MKRYGNPTGSASYESRPPARRGRWMPPLLLPEVDDEDLVVVKLPMLSYDSGALHIFLAWSRRATDFPV